MWGRLQPRTFVRSWHLWSWSEQQCYHCSLSTNSTRTTWICDLASISLLMSSVWGFHRLSHARKKSRVFAMFFDVFFPPGCLYVLLLLYSLLYCFRLIFCRSFKLDVENVWKRDVPRSDNFASLKALHRSVQFVHRRPQRRGSASALAKFEIFHWHYSHCPKCPHCRYTLQKVSIQ